MEASTTSFVAKFGQDQVAIGINTIPNTVSWHYHRVGLTTTEYALVTVIASYQHTPALPYPSATTLALVMGVSPRAVQYLIKSIKTKGMLLLGWRNGHRTYDFTPLFDACMDVHKTKSGFVLAGDDTVPQNEVSRHRNEAELRTKRSPASPEEDKDKNKMGPIFFSSDEHGRGDEPAPSRGAGSRSPGAGIRLALGSAGSAETPTPSANSHSSSSPSSSFSWDDVSAKVRLGLDLMQGDPRAAYYRGLLNPLKQLSCDGHWLVVAAPDRDHRFALGEMRTLIDEAAVLVHPNLKVCFIG